jgi:ribosomal protein L7/L12
MQTLVWILIIVALAVAFFIKLAAAQGKKDAGVLASFADLHLTGTHLIEGNPASGQRHELPGLVARVEDSGTLNRRITATRLATLGPFALAAKKKQDDREVYLTVEGATMAIVRSVLFKTTPTAGADARKFAAQLNLMARTTPAETATAPVEFPKAADKISAATEAFVVTLVSAGAHPIAVIKAVRELTPGMTLTQAKTIVEQSPSVLEQATDGVRAEQLRAGLSQAGANVLVTADS